jgi:hypothetical protein
MRYSAVSSEINVSAATDTCVLYVKAPADRRVKVTGFSVSFQGKAASDDPALIEVSNFTTDGTMTSVTPVARDADAPAASVTAAEPDSAEPTQGTDIYDRFYLTPNGGTLIRDFTPEDYIIADAGERVGILVNTPTSAIDTVVQINFEE